MRFITGFCSRLRSALRKPIRFEDIRTEPISRQFGYDRGTPLDRYYIEKFLRAHASVISGRVLEVADDAYSRKFGRDVSQYQILHVEPLTNATVVGDLTKPALLPKEIADCFICTQTFNFIYDLESAAEGAWTLLTPNGTLLATLAGISQVSRYDMDRWGDYWRFTVLSAKRLFEKYFSEVEVFSYGNVFAAKAFLDGLAVEDIPDKACLDVEDADYSVTVAVAARKAA